MSTQLAVIAGLGNPGSRYERTLHNAGFWFVDALAARGRVSFRLEKRFDAEMCKLRIADTDLWLVKPQRFMNLSGGPLRAVLDYYRLGVTSLLVAHDEIDLPPGTVRLKMGGGHGGHNGLRDVTSHCGPNFLRLRLGVGHPGTREQVTGYVLKPGTGEVEKAVTEAIDRALDVMPLLVERGLQVAMNRLHTEQGSAGGH